MERNICKRKEIHCIWISLLVLFLVFGIQGCNKTTKTTGGMHDVLFHTLGTVEEIKEDSVVIRAHGEDEDSNYRYKKALHYLDDEKVEFYWTNSDGDLNNLEIGDIIEIDYFAYQEDERPLPVYWGDWIGKEKGETSIMLYESKLYTKAEVESAAQTALEYFYATFAGCKMIDLRYEESIYEEEAREWAEQNGVEEAVIFVSDFETDETGVNGTMDPNSIYMNWKWVLVQNNGEWEIVDENN